MAGSVEFDNEKFMESYASINNAEASFESALSSANSIAGISIPSDYPKTGELLNALNDLKGMSTNDMSNALTMYKTSAQHISDLEGIEEETLQEIIDRLATVSDNIEFKTSYGNYEAGIFYYPVSVVDENGRKSSYIMQVKVPEGLTENSNPSLYFYMPGAGERDVLDKDGKGYHNTNEWSAYEKIINSSYTPDNTIMVKLSGPDFKDRNATGVALRASAYNSLQEIIKKYNVNTNSIHGAGYSLNGASGYMFAAEYPDFMTTYTAISDNLYSINKFNDAEKSGLAQSTTSFYLTCSGGEGSNRGNMMNNYNYLVNNGKNVHFVIMDGCSHDTVPYVFNEAYFNEIVNNNAGGIHTFNTANGTTGNIVHVNQKDMYQYIFRDDDNSGNGFANGANYSLLGLKESNASSNGTAVHVVNEGSNADIGTAIANTTAIATGVVATGTETASISETVDSSLSNETYNSESTKNNNVTYSNTSYVGGGSSGKGSSYVAPSTNNASVQIINSNNVIDTNKILSSNTTYNNLPPTNFSNMTIFENNGNVLSYGTLISENQFQSYIDSLRASGYLLQSDGATWIKGNDIITVTYSSGYIVINIFSR